jgi:hypothetical protein
MSPQSLWDGSLARCLRRAIIPTIVCAGLTLAAVLVTARPALAMNPCNEPNPPAQCLPPPPPVAPQVTNLHATACGPLCLQWDWTGHAGDTDYLVTTTDKTTGQVLSSLTGTDGGTHAADANHGEVCGHTYQIAVVTVKSGDTNSPPVTSNITLPACVAPPVTNLHSTACGPLCLQWDWTGHAGDTDYLVTTTDKTTGQVLSSLTGTDGGTHAADTNHGEVCGHTYQIAVVTVKTGDTNSPSVTSNTTLPACT